MFKQIWNNINNSLLLVLPLFSDIAENVKLKNYDKFSYPFLSLCFEYGIQNTYLYRVGKEDLKYQLILVFNEEVLKDKHITDSEYYSFNERIVDSKYCVSVERLEDLVVYTLNIPEKYHDDIDLITVDDHDNVSTEYKKALKVNFKNIPKHSSKLGSAIVSKNLPHFILIKDEKLRKEINNFLYDTEEDKVKFGIKPEMIHWRRFSKEKETFKHREDDE